MATLPEHKRKAVREEIERRGLHCHQWGKAWRVVGVGVDIIVADLAYLDAKLLTPVHWHAVAA